MNHIVKNLMMVVILLAAAQQASAASLQDEIDKKYQKVYNLILEKNFDQAEGLLDDIIKNYPHSAWTDDSEFWRCYIKQQRGQDDEQAYECFQSFLKKYGHSKWADDARSAMLQIARKLVDEGHEEYQVYIESLENETDKEVALAALQALASRGDERALQIVSNLYDSTKDPQVLRKIVYVLGTMDSQEAGERLADIARSDSSEALRTEAVFWLSQRPDADRNIKILKEILQKDKSERVRKKAIFSLAQIDLPRVEDELIDIARHHSDLKLRQEAVFWLSQSHASARVVDFLEELALKDKELSVRKKALFALSQIGSSGSLKAIQKIASQSGDLETREQAVFWLSQAGDSQEIISFLRELARNDPQQKIREKAIFSISQLPADRARPVLIEFARSGADTDTRTKAIFWLSQMPPSAELVDLLKGLVFDDKQKQVQEKALFSLAQMDENSGIAALIDVAKNHPDLSIRKKAIFWLGQSKDSRAVKAIEEILYKQ